MKLSKAQLEYIEKTRNELERLELEIMRIPERKRYGENGRGKELMEIYSQHRFFNYMIRLHNVELKAERLAQKELEAEVERVMKDEGDKL